MAIDKVRDIVIYLPPETYAALAVAIPPSISNVDPSYKGSNRIFYSQLDNKFPLVNVIFRPLGAAISDIPYMDKMDKK